MELSESTSQTNKSWEKNAHLAPGVKSFLVKVLCFFWFCCMHDDMLATMHMNIFKLEIITFLF